jgi:hypothetical protein
MAKNADWYVTAGGAGIKDGTTWAKAFDEAAYEIHKEGALVAGDYHWIEDGAYTLDSDVDSSARDGTAISPVLEIGVKGGTTNEPPVYSDWSLDTADKPFFDGVTFIIKVGDYYKIKNINFESSATAALETGLGCIIENCKFNNDIGVVSVNFALKCFTQCKVMNSEIESLKGNGLSISNDGRILFNYIHDCPEATHVTRGNGITNASRSIFAFNILDECNIGINSSSDDDNVLLNNTFYETDTGLSETDGIGWLCINNIMEGNDADGFKWTTQTDINEFMDNHGDDVRCTDMWDLVAISPDPNADHRVSTGDPDFDTPGADFALDPGSPCEDIAMYMILGVTGGAMNKGAWQNPVGGVGGGALMRQPGWNGGINA